jgi:glutamate-1-semialdehyde 2,1-aminomutase
MILEPVPMNAGVIPPDAGYLQGLADLLHRHGALLAFDEVKTGAVVAFGGATERFGVRPDVIALAKAIGGGLPVAAVGGTEEAMRVLTDGTMEFEGTFNGNPLSMVAAKAVLTEILTPDVYPRLDELGTFYAEGLRRHVARYGLPAIVTAVGCRGSVHFRAEPVRDFRDAVESDDTLARLAWLHQLNAGVFVPSGDPWTFSVAHSEEDLRRSIDAFASFAEDVAS